jgi:hypothetical protein
MFIYAENRLNLHIWYPLKQFILLLLIFYKNINKCSKNFNKFKKN